MTTVVEQLEVYDIPFTGLEATVLGWVREALDLRHGAGEDPLGALGVMPTDDHHRLLEYLARAQQRAARVDQLLANCTQARARARRAQEQARFAAEVAFDSATQQNAARRTIEFTTREERKADAALDSLEERRIAHHAARLVSITDEAYEVVRQIHWQLENLRKDARAAINALHIDSRLET